MTDSPTPISDAIVAYVRAEITVNNTLFDTGGYPGRVEIRRIEKSREIRDEKLAAMQRALGEATEKEAEL